MKGKHLFLTLALAPGLVVGGAKIIATKSSDRPAVDEDTKAFAAFSEVVKEGKDNPAFRSGVRYYEQDRSTRKTGKTKRKTRTNARRHGKPTHATSTTTKKSPKKT
jgi:hypothetical protein